MAQASQTPSRRPSVSTLILIAAGLIAAVSAAIAVSRTHGDSASESPAAKDWRMGGWAYAQNGDAAEAARAYRKATEIEPDNGENWSSLGEALQTPSQQVVAEAAEAI